MLYLLTAEEVRRGFKPWLMVEIGLLPLVNLRRDERRAERNILRTARRIDAIEEEKMVDGCKM